LIRFSRVILSGYAFVPISEIDIGTERALLTVSSRFEPGVAIPMYKEIRDWFGYPRYWHDWKYVAESVEDRTSAGSPINVSVVSSLWPEQEALFSDWQKRVSAGDKGFLIHARPGWGKTVVLIRMIAWLGTTALVVVPKTDLVTQWVNRLVAHSTLHRKQIGTVVGRDADWRGKAVVVALVHSLKIGYLGKEFRRHFGQVWFDEVHTSVSPPTFASLVGQFPARFRGGASATPVRPDGLHTIFEKHIVQRTFTARSGRTLKSKVFVLKVGYDYGSVPAYLNDHARRGVLLSLLAKSRLRNDLLARAISRFFQRDRRIVIISDRTEQLWRLRKLLALDYNIPDNLMGYYCRSVSPPGAKKKIHISDGLQRRVASKARVILATYGSMKLGTDIADLNSLVFATPQSDPRQSKGRIERWMSGKSQPVILDVWDSAYEETTRWWYSRNREYRREALDVIFKEVN
jgi:superfamily II DNA or RNA helicase